jgi:hypothetical protein
MRACGAAIIHVDAEQQLKDDDGIHVLSANVLIEIGAAIALYGRRYILLVHESQLPSILGIFEVRYSGHLTELPTSAARCDRDLKNHQCRALYEDDQLKKRSSGSKCTRDIFGRP